MNTEDHSSSGDEESAHYHPNPLPPPLPLPSEDLASQILRKAKLLRPIRQLESRISNAAEHQQRRQQWERGETLQKSITWAIFETQQDAFNAIDKVYREFISRRVEEEKALPRGIDVKNSSKVKDSPPPPLKVFSFESGPEGRRRFLVASVEAFWLQYIKLAPSARHFYEVIREDTPVFLYFDLEFARSHTLNANVDGDQLVGILLYKVCKALLHRHNIQGLSYKNVVHLDSSTLSKFSRHLVIHLPNGEMFRDVAHLRAFVLGIVDQFKTEPESEKMWLDKGEQVITDGAAEGEDGTSKKTFFADLGVYTRNRVFRMLLSSKFGKQALLLPSSTNQFNANNRSDEGQDVNEHDLTYWINGAKSSSSSSFSSSLSSIVPLALSLEDEKKLWEASLITGAQPPLPPIWFERELQEALNEAREKSSSSKKRPREEEEEENLDNDKNNVIHPRLNIRLLHEKLALSTSTSSSSSSSASNSAHPINQSSLATLPQGRSFLNTSSPDDIVIDGGRSPPPFPDLIKFVLYLAMGPIDTQLASADSIIHKAGTLITTSVRTWSAIARNIHVELPDQESSSSSSSSTTTTSNIKSVRVLSKVTLNITGSRFCNSIGRQHKSNGVFWTINLLDGGSLRQGCFDTDCKKLESRAVQIPLSLIPDQLPRGARIVV